MNNKEKMLNGLIYNPHTKELIDIRKKAHDLCRSFNYSNNDDEKRDILEKLIPSFPKTSNIVDPVHIDYGVNTIIGEHCFFNFNLTILDTSNVIFEDYVYVGPNCSFLTPLHPLIGDERRVKEYKDGTYDLEYSNKIKVGHDTWFGCNVTVLPGVTIGSNCVIGAGSVVTHDMPSNYLCYGNPCKAIRKITEKDSVLIKKELFSE